MPFGGNPGMPGGGIGLLPGCWSLDAINCLCWIKAMCKSASGMTLYTFRGRFWPPADSAAVPASASLRAFHSANALVGTPSIPKISMS